MLNMLNKLSGFEVIHEIPQSFLANLIQLEKEGYFLRGVERSVFSAQPSAFRTEKISENRKIFPIPYSEIKYNWFYHNEVLKIVRDSFKISDDEIRNHPVIYRLFNLLSYLMVCNYLFAKYKEKNPKHAFETDHEQMKYRKSNDWAERETFIGMVEYYFPKFLTIEALDKSWRKDGYIDDIITGIDMSFPQHYGVSTATLDFTKKFLISIYFSIESHLNISFQNESGLYIAEKTVIAV